MTSNIKPCPFCGGEAIELTSSLSGPGQTIGCVKCGKFHIAIWIWNTRIFEAGAREMEEELAEMRKGLIEAKILLAQEKKSLEELQSASELLDSLISKEKRDQQEGTVLAKELIKIIEQDRTIAKLKGVLADAIQAIGEALK